MLLVPTLHCREVSACNSSLAPANSHYKQVLTCIHSGRREGSEPPAPCQADRPGWVTSPGVAGPPARGLGAVLGAAGAIASTSALPCAPAEAADVPQTLSRMQRHIPLLIQITTPACPLCPLPRAFRPAVPQSLFFFFFLLDSAPLRSSPAALRQGVGEGEEGRGR